MSRSTVDNPFFARVWTVMARHEPESLKRLRRENLAGLSGRVLEVGAGTRTNFELYPATVTEVVAVEPERSWQGWLGSGRGSAGARHRQHRHGRGILRDRHPV